MSTFLFAWNPNKWEWKEDELTNQVLTVAAKGSAEDRWSCGNRKDLPIESRFFLIRLGKEPRGIVGSGITMSDPELGPHWDAMLSPQGKEAPYVDLKFDFLSKEPLVMWDELQEEPYSTVSWGIQSSGVLLPDAIADELEILWNRRISGTDPVLPDELPFDVNYQEGTKKSITVNAYERNAQARAACIASLGYKCSVCDLILEDLYGTIASGFIHVHHTIPLAEIGKNYRVDPKKDLIPVCPNCHAIIHRRKPPLSVAEARRLIGKK